MENLQTDSLLKKHVEVKEESWGRGDENIRNGPTGRPSAPDYDKILKEVKRNDVHSNLHPIDDHIHSGNEQQTKCDNQRMGLAVNGEAVDKDNTIIDDNVQDVTFRGNEKCEQFPVLRSRLKKTPLSKPKDEDKVQWSNVPRSGDEQLTRLKSACHYAWINFSNPQPSLMNNNFREYKKHHNFNLEGKFSTSGRNPIQTLDKTANKPLCSVNQLQSFFDNERLLNLYKFLKLLVSIVILFLKIVLVSFSLIFFLYCLMVLHKPTQAFVSRHTQDLIYPFMRTIRFGSLPFISQFPQLHELYEDACVLANPFFEMNDVSCWPCESVRHVIDLTGFSNFTSGYYHSGIPFIVKDAFVHNVSVDDIYKMYEESDNVAGSVLLKSSFSAVQTLDDLIKFDVRSGNFYSRNLHVTWKINRVQFARSMRKFFSRPYYIPNSTEISVQHFLFVDEPEAEQYAFPVTEFANVFVMQADGRRLIVLIPVKHCRSHCKAISVVLEPKQVLFYNWLFWRPVSFPMKAFDGNDLSVSYIGSFY